MSSAPQRPIRIAGCSGAASDRRHAMAMLAANCPTDPVDVIIGDWLSEANMTARGSSKTDSPDTDAYEPTFLESLAPALPDIAAHGIKVAANAGASDTAKLAAVVTSMVQKQGLDLKVAYVSGDEVMPAIRKAQQAGRQFENICTSQLLSDWQHEPVYAQAYLGGLGIALAFSQGADIVVCGRVSDASPVIGAAYYWHSWERHELDKLANAFVAGHLIECSNYVCGGNFTGFKSLEGKGWENIGYPIAEVSHSGNVIITKNKGSGGEVSTQTCSSQLLYEIQGPWYFNSDVTAVLDELWFEQLGTDRVALRGVKGDLPPSTTKVGLTAKGGYQAEAHWFLCGLDIEAKARMMEAQCRHLLRPHIPTFTHLSFTVLGSPSPDTASKNSATATLRILVQAPTAAAIAPAKFLRPVLDPIMQGYPGATPQLDTRLGFPKPIYEYFVTLLPQADVQHRVHMEGQEWDVEAPPKMKVWDRQQPTTPDVVVVDEGGFGPTIRGPLGWIVHARSGDKGSDANVGFWVRFADEWEWLRGLLSVGRVKELLGDEYKAGNRIVSLDSLRFLLERIELDRFANKSLQDRAEFANMYAVHFLLHDHLDRGVSCSTTCDFLGKNVAEFLRSRYVELPTKYLNRGRL